MAENVLFDPQFSLQKILRPFRDFEAVYEGKLGSTPIAFFEEGASARDPDAGKAGFSPDLLSYVNVPMGALVLLWIPMTFWPNAPGPLVSASYRYRIKWRMRTVTDYTNRRTPFHLSKQFPGTPDTLTPANPQRLILPAAYDSVELQQPTPLTGPVDFALRPRAYIPPPITAVLDTLPLLPGGASGVHQQGVFDPAEFGLASDLAKNALFFPPQLFIAKGDQMIVEALKLESEILNAWEFGSAPDYAFSKIYGSDSPPASGIYLFTGSGPHQD